MERKEWWGLPVLSFLSSHPTPLQRPRACLRPGSDCGPRNQLHQPVSSLVSAEIESTPALGRFGIGVGRGEDTLLPCSKERRPRNWRQWLLRQGRPGCGQPGARGLAVRWDVSGRMGYYSVRWFLGGVSGTVR